MTSELTFLALEERSVGLCKEVARFIRDSGLEIEPPVCSRPDGLSIAIVGPYNSGKSTIVKALTGRQDVPIGARPTTEKVRTYEWKTGVTVVDTPGVRTGRDEGSEHDAEANRGVRSADLVVFVISDEGFDDDVADYFKGLLPDRRRTRSLLLVSNKLGRSAADPDDLLPDIEKVLEPLTLDDVPVVFIDADRYLRSLTADDPSDVAELQRLSRWDSFLTEVDAFAERSGRRGQAVQPLHPARDALEELLTVLSTPDEGSKRRATLLRRRDRALRFGQEGARDEAGMMIRAAARQIERLGDEVAQHVEPNATIDFEALIERTNQEAKEVTEELHRDLMDKMDEWLERTASEIGPLDTDEVLAAIRNEEAEVAVEHGANRGRAGVGKVVRQARGPMGRLGRFFSHNARAGQSGHQIVYKVGKALGHNFKPWGAVKGARFIGKVGKAAGPVAAVLGLALDAKEEFDEHKRRRQARDARRAVRDAYASLAADVAEDARESVERFLDDTLGNELRASKEMRDEISAQEQQASSLASQAQDLQRRIDQLFSLAAAT